MKRTVITFSLCALFFSASAQFKVRSDGRVAINGSGNSSYYLYCNNTNQQNGLYFAADGNYINSTIYGGKLTSSNASQSVGLKGSANGISNSIGVFGNADAGTKAIGIVGSINQSNSTTGAGVYGTIYNDWSYNNTFSQEAYFVNNYAQVSATEDRASTFEYMMAPSKASCLNENMPVWKKAKYMARTMELTIRCVNSDTTEYWERFL